MKKKTHKINIGKLDKILELRKKGLTLREIGILVGLSNEGVRYLLNRFQKVNNQTKPNK